MFNVGYNVYTFAAGGFLENIFGIMHLLNIMNIALIGLAIALLLHFIFFINRKYIICWLTAVVVIIFIFATPRVDVTIHDKISSISEVNSEPKMINNVPWAIASFSSAISSIGGSIIKINTSIFENIASINIENSKQDFILSFDLLSKINDENLDPSLLEKFNANEIWYCVPLIRSLSNSKDVIGDMLEYANKRGKTFNGKFECRDIVQDFTEDLTNYVEKSILPKYSYYTTIRDYFSHSPILTNLYSHETIFNLITQNILLKKFTPDTSSYSWGENLHRTAITLLPQLFIFFMKVLEVFIYALAPVILAVAILLLNDVTRKQVLKYFGFIALGIQVLNIVFSALYTLAFCIVAERVFEYLEKYSDYFSRIEVLKQDNNIELLFILFLVFFTIIIPLMISISRDLEKELMHIPSNKQDNK